MPCNVCSFRNLLGNANKAPRHWRQNLCSLLSILNTAAVLPSHIRRKTKKEKGRRATKAEKTNTFLRSIRIRNQARAVTAFPGRLSSGLSPRPLRGGGWRLEVRGFSSYDSRELYVDQSKATAAYCRCSSRRWGGRLL